MSAGDERDDFFGVSIFTPPLGDLAATPEDRHPVGNFENVGDIVTDQHDRAAAIGEAAYKREYLSSLGDSEGSRRLIHDDELSLKIKRSRYRDRLTLAAGKSADRHTGVGNVGVQFAQKRDCPARHLSTAKKW
jgi:hypothetical protein